MFNWLAWMTTRRVQKLEVIWELELDGQILDKEAWQSIGKKRFDQPRYFGAYIPQDKNSHLSWWL